MAASCPVPWVLALHGGAGLIAPHSLPPAREAEARHVLAQVLEDGAMALSQGAEAVDVAVSVVQALEDAPAFNAGRGAVFAADGTQRFDASVMRGSDRAAGAVAALQRIRHPIAAARAVMEHSPHVMLVGDPAERFARDHGCEARDAAWFFDAHRFDQLLAARRTGAITLDHEDPDAAGDAARDPHDPKVGTVGAVVRDDRGHLAAATSTGGMTHKHPGRVGDTGVIGAGTWAWDATVAVSATGHGEPFVRAHVAARVSDLVELAGCTVEEAVARVLDEDLPALDGATGGLIAVGPDGEPVLHFTSGGMYRAWASATGLRGVAIW